ncbi:hypothetical protein I4U23_009614 [Adineta vaga]|nr:hypothetical protein I4U23_009614 [Adineta vaga]
MNFAYNQLGSFTYLDQTEKVLLDKFVCILAQVLQHLFELHPSCWDQLNSLGLFDRLEIYSQKTSNEDTQLKVTELISRSNQIRDEYDQKKKKSSKQRNETQIDRDDPPPDDFHQLSIYPTLEDIFEPQMPYLRKNITTGHYKNGTHYLDIHFRLLREDFLQPLREAICQYMNDDDRSVTFRNTNVRLYRNTILTGTICSHVGILFSLAIDFETLPKSISWTNSRRLIYGNLLAATFDDFATSCFLLTVDDRSNIDKNGTISVRCQKELCDHKLMRIPPGTSFTLLETTSYFEAYRPILQALQNIKDDQIPLEKYILHCDTNVMLPNYFELKSEIDFQLLLVKNTEQCEQYNGGLSNIKDLTTWPNAKQLGLDQSQYQALQLALTKSVALIQGPPGCGKTFLGVRLAELFYHNRQRIAGCERPILMICYTNHALDQFLSSIIQKLSLQPGQVVRVGGRSTHTEIEPFLIQNLRQQRRDARSKNREISEKYDILRNIKSQLDDCQKFYYDCSQKILDISQLLRVMDKNQFLTLIDPILLELDIFVKHWNLNKGGIYCCRSTGIEEDSGTKAEESISQSDDDDDDDEILSEIERSQRMKNRIDCHKLNKLSSSDERRINQLFIEWLGAKHFEIINYQDKEEIEDDGQGEFQEKQRNKKKKNQIKAAAVLKEILNDPMISSTSNNNDENVNNLEEDEEETRRQENIDNSYIPFTLLNPKTEKEKAQLNTEQLEYMQRLLTTRTGLLSDDDVRKIENLCAKSLNKDQRQALYRYWLYKYVQLLTEEWFRLNEQYDENHQILQELWLANDRSYMDDAFIIAMTTHCASRYQKVLKQIAPRICIVEEAAEVFESHIITAIGERIEHLILIGDHIQLRPSPNVYTLAKHFKLDVSLFERLINNKMPSIQLCEQHRSIPMISKLTHHFYDIPILNHPSVCNRSTITGVSHPLYFIDHSNSEENVADGVSKRNSYECHYIIQLANYLINQGYEKSSITILTTYMGQRQLIYKTITQSFKHLKGIHITVVDNYQGEENRIILLSLVRSNVEKRLGYLAVDNRICVTLSRAQDGFYVIGNFHLLAENNETWKIIVDKMKEAQLIGSGLPINCANHLTNQLICHHPNDFLKRPLGGCGSKCETRLACGHQCPLSCHNTSHIKLTCQKPCSKKYDDCDHRCEKKCHSGTACLPCSVMIALKMPHCEHTSDIPCFMRKTNQLDCGVLVAYTCPLGHHVQVRCCDLRNQELRDRLCIHPCDFTLKCGHPCTGTCSTCLQGRFHCPCDQQELIVYVCGHSKKQRCHELGPRCELPYIKLCNHSDEPNIRNNISKCLIYQCMRYCLNRCKHTRCEQRCRAECDRVPCNEKCTRRFDCEHYCNGICGEPCIDCLHCRDKNLTKDISDVIRGQNLRYATFVQLECGHLFKPDVLDAHVESFKEKQFLSKGFIRVDYPRCPTCQWSLVKCKRYSSLIKMIHARMENVTATALTLSEAGIDTFGLAVILSTLDVKLPTSIKTIIERNFAHQRRRRLTKLFIHVTELFEKLSNRMDIERDKLLRAVYEYVEKNDSIFLTRQQWSDLENEYNRLFLIDRFRTAKESSELDYNELQIETINDILSTSNEFTQLACEVCNALLKPDEDTTDTWKSILPGEITWNDFEKDRLLCDGKWIVCVKSSSGHLLWEDTITEQSICQLCQQVNTTASYRVTGRGKPIYRGNYNRGRR